MKGRRKTKTLFGLKVGEFVALATFLMTCAAFVVAGVQYFDRKFASIDKKFDEVDRRFEKVEVHLEGIDNRLNRIEERLTQTSDLVDSYLTWRFIFVNDPVRKNLVPVYDPKSRKLEFIEKGK